MEQMAKKQAINPRDGLALMRQSISAYSKDYEHFRRTLKW